MELAHIPEQFGEIGFKVIDEDQRLDPQDDIDLFCTESIDDLDQVWEDQREGDVFKINPHHLNSLERRKPKVTTPNSQNSSEVSGYTVGDEPEDNPYIAYLMREFCPERNIATLLQSNEVVSCELSGFKEVAIVDEMEEMMDPPSPLQDRLTMVDSFNETSMNDVIIFRDDSLTPYLEQSPRNSPSFDGSNGSTPRSLSPASDHVVPGNGEEYRRIMRSCDPSNDHIVPSLMYIEE